MSKHLENKTFGKLCVVRPAKFLGKAGRFRWLCVCSCGKYCYAYTNNLTTGTKKSCGCGSNRYSKAGMSGTKAYSSWFSMHKRCYDTTSQYYHKYGGRGISVCKRWHNFQSFLEDMGQPQFSEQTLERSNNALGYSLSNCSWASRTQQARNRTRFENNSSGRTGVYKLPSGKFRATITVLKETISLGCFNNYEDACTCRSEAELNYFGFVKE